MGKAELGTKRHCQSCGAKFYDLCKDPIICPICSTQFIVPTAAVVAAAVASGLDDDAAFVVDPNLISLEDAEKEASGKKDLDVDIDLDDDEDDTFLPDEDEEDDEDVSNLIEGDINDEDE